MVVVVVGPPVVVVVVVVVGSPVVVVVGSGSHGSSRSEHLNVSILPSKAKHISGCTSRQTSAWVGKKGEMQHPLSVGSRVVVVVVGEQ